MVARSTKAGVETPATGWAGECGPRAILSGAQRRPGSKPRRQMRKLSGSGVGMISAQRRPGSKPRRQPSPLRGEKPGPRRSTKAGVETPATASKTFAEAAGVAAQRRPGSKPRRQSRRWWWRGTGRSAAQRRPGSKPRRQRVGRGFEESHPDHRSTKAGVETPATAPRRSSRCPPTPGSLNEGRGRNPGDSRVRREAVAPHASPRSTKAGVETPATAPSSGAGRKEHVGAQRRPGSKPRRQEGGLQEALPVCARSTKAGVETPATAVPPAADPPSRYRAQRRPGSKPRRQNIQVLTL